MAEYRNVDDHSTDNGRTGQAKSRRPAAGLLFAGLIALLVSVWSLIGPEHFQSLDGGPSKWIVVAAAVAVGLVLVFAPGRRK
ncbi:hypothetical protein [Rhodococcus kronopolitis]|uniref:DUF2631 domain-containing protein n=1 Tax=Rhodococcus kronopolitis TaxID=1460226 RepID=A0ABV9FQ79_9NOCA